MKAAFRLLAAPSLAVALVFSTGCASHRSGPTRAEEEKNLEKAALQNPPAKTRFGSYSRVELKALSVADGPKDRAEDEFARRVDTQLFREFQRLWPEVTPVPRSAGFTTPGRGLLLVEPTIVATRLVDPFEREVLTWAKGDATVLVKVIFRDATTGESVAEPVFHRKSPYFWAAWSGGATDSELDRLIAGDVVTYVRDNL